MAVTVEELQILIEAKYQDAINGLQAVEKKMMNMATKLAPQFNQQMQSAIGSLAQPLLKAQRDIQAATSKSVGAGKRQSDATIQQQKDIEDAVKRATDRLKEQANAMKGGTIGPAASPLKNTRLATEIPERLLNPNLADAAKEAQKMANLQTAANLTAQSIDRVNRAYEAMQQASSMASGTMAAKLENVNQKIQLQQQMLDTLTEHLGRTVAQSGLSEQSNRLQQQLLGAENGLIKLIEQYNKLASAAQEAANQMKSASSIVPTGAGDLTITLSRLDAIRESGAVKDLSSNYGDLSQNTNKVNNAMKGKNKTLKDQTAATKKETSAVGNWAKSFMKVIKNIILLRLAYKALRSIIKFVTDGIRSAISAPEIENMFNVAFGRMAYEADQFAQKLKKSFGVDVIASKQMLAVFQNFNDSMGIGERTAYKMSTTLTQLAYDMASLYEMDVNQVYENLQSGLQGMPRALYKYGIAVTDANIKQTALEYGIGATGRELTSQEKIIARYITILKQTSNAQGDMARTIESPANQLRVLKSQLVAAGRAIGQAFMPFIQAILPVLNTLAVVLERVGNALARFTYRLIGRDFDAEMKAKQDALKDMQNIAGGTAGAENDLAEGIDKAGKAAKKALAPFDELNILQDRAGSGTDSDSGFGFEFPDLPTLPEPTGESPYIKMADELAKKFEDVFKNISELWDRYFSKPFSDAINKITPQIQKLKETYENIISDILTLTQPFSDWFHNNAIPMLQQLLITGGDVLAGFLDSANMVIKDVWDALFPMIESYIKYALPAITDFITECIKTFGVLFDEVKKIFDMIWSDAIKPALDLISQIWQDAMKNMKDWWDKWGAETFENIRTTIKTTSEIFQNLWNEILKPIFGQIFETLSKLWEEHLNPLMQEIGEFAGTFINAAMDIYNEFVAPIVNYLIETLGPAISEFVSGGIAVLGELLGGVLDVVKGLLEALGGLVEFIAGVFTGDWKRAWEGIKQIFTGAINAINDAADAVISALMTAFEGLIDTIGALLSKIKDLARSPFMPKLSKSLNGSFGMTTHTIDIFSSYYNSSIGDIPQFASGTVLRKPTIGLMAEYAGAASNPEIVTPQNIMQETFVASLAPLMTTFHQDIMYLAEVVKQNGVEISPNATGIFNIVRKESDNYKRITGSPAFTV